MMADRKNGGFTLVELMVTIVVGSLITLAATTVLLLGLRVNNQSTHTVIQQNTARVVLTMLENLAAEGEISKIEAEPDFWNVYGAGEEPILSYSDDEDTIYARGTPILENVIASFVTVIGEDENVLNFAIETDEGSYDSSVYCRTLTYAPADNAGESAYEDLIAKPAEGEGEGEANPPVDKEGREAFLKALSSQRSFIGGGVNRGLILEDGLSTGWYYSQWYIGSKGVEGWDKDTPWCACFVSWGLSQVTEDYIEVLEPKADLHVVDGELHWFASVDRFAEYLQKSGQWKYSQEHKALAASEDQVIDEPKPGDIIFIDWSGGDDPAHVGVVLTTATENGKEYVYTLEGNSANMVAIRKYAIDNEIILAYGVLNWKNPQQTNS